MKRILKYCLFTCLAVAAPHLTAATFYVDTNHVSANNSNPGTEAAPWKTIQKAADVLKAGDTVLVKAGTYTELTSSSDVTGLVPEFSGTPGNYITYQAYPGHRVILDQQRGGIGFYIKGKKHIRISGFEITNIYDTNSSDKNGGVVTASGSSTRPEDIIVENNHIHAIDGPNGNNVGGIRFDDATNCVARDNIIHDIFVGGVDNGNAAGIHSYGMENMLLENNTIYNAHNGVYHKASTGNIGALIKNNLIHDTSRGIFYDIAGGGSPIHFNQRVTQNIFYNNKDAIYMDARGSGRPQNNGFHVWNNTVILPANGSGVTFFNSTDVNVYNNLFFGPTSDKTIRVGFDIDITPPIASITEMDFNNYFNSEEYILRYDGSGISYISLSVWTAQEGFDQNSNNVDPLFVDAANRNYKLQNTSPLINAGKGSVTIGAYITGNEIIGAATIRPKSPTNLTIK